MSQRFAVVHEAGADFHTATELADRVLIDAIDWMDEHLIADQREWVGTVPVDRRLTWKAIPQMAREAGIRARGHFDGEPGEADAAAARRAILYLLATIPDLKAILLIRDQDDQPERRIGLEQARGQDHGGAVIVVGLAVVERESWIISGFDPKDDAETVRLDEERKTLGFNPCERSHELTACKNDHAARSPKRVLRQLSGNNGDRERHCWTHTPLDRLRARGGENGLAPYLHEVRDRLAPLIGHVAEG
ncbi:MAG TPA: hypothetical protein DDY78_30110 [Planctomycetales bacterium]|jgi:hypothetical protein|nr:hypothetical protein [Planctomycetales bacterium]